MTDDERDFIDFVQSHPKEMALENSKCACHSDVKARNVYEPLDYKDQGYTVYSQRKIWKGGGRPAQITMIVTCYKNLFSTLHIKLFQKMGKGSPPVGSSLAGYLSKMNKFTRA